MVFFFFNDTATTEIYTLSLHDALPIYERGAGRARDREDADRAAREHGPRRSQLPRHFQRPRRVRVAPRQGRGRRNVPRGEEDRPRSRGARRAHARPQGGPDGRHGGGGEGGELTRNGKTARGA